MKKDLKVFESDREFELELGGKLTGLRIAYHTYGRLSEKRDNVVWVCHALTADSDVADWWPHTVEAGAFLDPERFFVVCANIIGSPYGSTSPLDINPATGKVWYGEFPKLTVGDWVRAHQILATHLGIEGIYTLVGSSVGGFQALEWAAREPERFEKLILLATSPYASPWTIAIDETQRMAIRADQSYGEARADAGQGGLAAARAIGLLSYRGSKGYDLTQQDPDTEAIPEEHRACTYQRYQGEKLVRRFNVYSYVTILDAFDTHNIGRGRGGIENVLSRIKGKTMVVGLTTDIVFPPEDMRRLAEMIPGSEYREIDSPFGHDGFLVEHEQLNEILMPFIRQNNGNR